VRLLLDTQVWLWMVSDEHRLNEAARTAITDPDNDLYLSVVSVWELAIKHADRAGAGRGPGPCDGRRQVRRIRGRSSWGVTRNGIAGPG